MSTTTADLRLRLLDSTDEKRGKEAKETTELTPMDSAHLKRKGLKKLVAVNKMAKSKKKSFSFDISKKYLKQIGVYIFSIGSSILVAYLISPLIHVPAEYIILPLSTSIAGTLLAKNINKLI